jgi:general secretion pathway protein M
MSTGNSISAYLTRFPIAATVLYGGLVAAFISLSVLTALDLLGQEQALSAATDTLSQLEKRAHLGMQSASTDPSIANGSAFLEDSTVTVAGATLLQRVASAVTQSGGNIVSSQVDLQGPLAKQGFVAVTANCELDQPALQKLLYDLEAGMPFLYVDQMEVQAPPGEKLRLMISISAQWQGTK